LRWAAGQRWIALRTRRVTQVVRGKSSKAAKLLERNIGLAGKLRAERFGQGVITSATSEYMLCNALAHLGRLDEAVEHGEAAVRIAEETDHLVTEAELRQVG